MTVLHLQFVRPDGEPETFHCKSVRRYTVGRGSTCEIRILDMKMSRQHFAVECLDGTWKLIDLGSTNGVTLGGETVVGSMALDPGDVIAAGATSLEVLAVTDHIELRPEDLQANPEQEEMPSVTDEIAVPASDNPWDGLPQEAGSESNEQGDGDTIALTRAGGQAPAQSEPKPVHKELKAVRTPVPEPTQATETHTDDESALVPAVPKELVEASEEHNKARAEAESAAATEARQDAPLELAPKADRPKETPTSTTQPALPASSSGMFITVLGRRIGPLDRKEAKALKAKELKGQLTEADLADYPQA